MVAICELLEVQLTSPDRFTVAPEDVVPIGMNCAVSPGPSTVCEAGIRATVATSEVPVPPPPPLEAVTFTVMLAEIRPLKPGALAVMRILLQDALPEVMSPVLLTVTHATTELA